MFRSKFGIATIIIGYLAGLVALNFLPGPAALLFPMVGAMVASAIGNAERKVRERAKERELRAGEQGRPPLEAGRQAGYAGPSSALPAGGPPGRQTPGPGQQSGVPGPSPFQASQPPRAGGAGFGQPAPAQQAFAGETVSSLGPEWDSIMEYIGTIEDMVLLEGKKNNLDSEIVQRTLSVLVRLNRIIPKLVEFGNSEINHKIQRLVLKDLNGAINPFLNLSGEAKQQNRRILLNGIRDIDKQISEYTSFLEQKDLIELKNKAELIHQRYGLKG